MCAFYLDAQLHYISISFAVTDLANELYKKMIYGIFRPALQPPPLKKQTNTNLLSGSFYQVDFIEYPEIQRNEQLV